jgi:hypothetical protein
MHHVCLFVLWACISQSWVTAADIKLEAEDGILTGVTVQTVIKPFSGRGYVSDFDKSDDKITFNVNIPNTNTSSVFYQLRMAMPVVER